MKTIVSVLIFFIAIIGFSQKPIERQTSKTTNLTVKYIKFKIKNNSDHRNHFYVVGSKPDGTIFSYGFPMMPLGSRSENWTVGSKIYKVNPLGIRKLLVTIKLKDKDSIIKLF